MGDELAVVEDRRRSLLAAKANLQEARAEHAKHANVFSKAGFEKVHAAGQDVQLASSKKWYNFWEKASRVPRTLKLSSGESMAWDEVAKTAMNQVKDLVQGGAFEAPSSKSGGTVEVSSDRAEKGVALLRIKKDVPVTPRMALLTHIRAEFNGQCDPSLVYMREHYTFRGGKTSLFHQVKNFGPSMIALRDVALFQTWEEAEDGTITVAAKSVEGNIPAKAVPGAVRSAVLLFGVQFKPKTVTKSSFMGGKSEVEGCEATVLCHTLLKGMLPAFLAKQFTVGEVFAHLAAMEAVTAGITAAGNAEELINKFVVYPDGPDADLDDEEEAAEPEAEQVEAEPEAEESA